MAKARMALPPLTDVIRIGAYYYPVVLRPEYGPHAFEHIQAPNGGPLNFTRRYTAARFLWDRERRNEQGF